MSNGRYDLGEARIGVLLLAVRPGGFRMGRIKETRNEKANMDALSELISTRCIQTSNKDGSFVVSLKGLSMLEKLQEEYHLAGWTKDLERIKEEYL